MHIDYGCFFSEIYSKMGYNLRWGGRLCRQISETSPMPLKHKSSEWLWAICGSISHFIEIVGKAQFLNISPLLK